MHIYIYIKKIYIFIKFGVIQFDKRFHLIAHFCQLNVVVLLFVKIYHMTKFKGHFHHQMLKH